ncbi:asparagine--tRNA ligase [Mycoplasmopsis citelli]|uniref:asparagine--tRNA ligase n=1 Tax=Mycoplasmopsis citelli TaxID=171281 RepID=UPI0021142A08|nr:asparagine--tRNA ligase [Mycoplasmopsis citelli]UUD36327.1 asparagine--tRNA ligase [Mycoplasmopsis citelli]
MFSVKKILQRPKYFNNRTYQLQGWVVSNRGNKKVRFISINDGSTIKSLQVVFKDQSFDFELLDKLKNGSGIVVEGILKETPQAQQPIELVAAKIIKYSVADEDYPIQNQEIKLETLRELPHLRHRTNLLRAIMLVRSTLAHEVHRYFMQRDFYYMNSPIITSNDGEGAGETFNVNDGDKEPFFGKDKKATLGVTGQLHGESAALGLQKIYTFAPTFRAEKSNTKRHLAEFWMIEPEVAFYDLYDDIALADDLLKVVIRNTLFKNKDEIQYLNDNLDNSLINRIEEFLNTPLKIVQYNDAIDQLAQVKHLFENQDIKFGLDLATEHEKYLTEVIYKAPIAVVNFPKDFKAFYMKQNDDGKTVASFDLLVPGVGELVGGSQRENDINKLTTRINELGINKEDLQWYLDLRRFGNVGSAGFGIGFERLVMYVTGAENIRDVIPYPRTSGNIRM